MTQFHPVLQAVVPSSLWRISHIPTAVTKYLRNKNGGKTYLTRGFPKFLWSTAVGLLARLKHMAEPTRSTHGSRGRGGRVVRTMLPFDLSKALLCCILLPTRPCLPAMHCILNLPGSNSLMCQDPHGPTNSHQLAVSSLKVALSPKPQCSTREDYHFPKPCPGLDLCTGQALCSPMVLRPCWSILLPCLVLTDEALRGNGGGVGVGGVA